MGKKHFKDLGSDRDRSKRTEGMDRMGAAPSQGFE